MADESAQETARRVGIAKLSDRLAQDEEVRIVCCEPQHDQICVHSVQHVSSVWVVSRRRSLQPDVSHDLVLSFSGHFGVAENNLDAFPTALVTQTIEDVPMQRATQLGHERSTGPEQQNADAEGKCQLVSSYVYYAHICIADQVAQAYFCVSKARAARSRPCCCPGRQRASERGCRPTDVMTLLSHGRPLRGGGVRPLSSHSWRSSSSAISLSVTSFALRKRRLRCSVKPPSHSNIQNTANQIPNAVSTRVGLWSAPIQRFCVAVSVRVHRCCSDDSSLLWAPLHRWPCRALCAGAPWRRCDQCRGTRAGSSLPRCLASRHPRGDSKDG